MNRPNILKIISHDTGRYLGCYGRQVATPEIDQLAHDGIRFDQYYCPAPQCSPSRGSIMTGLYPHNHGLMGLGHLGFSMHPAVETLPQKLAEAGYKAALIGLNHESIEDSSSAYSLGYEWINTENNPEDNKARKVAEKFESFLRDYQNAMSDQPFFASVGFHETHRPFDESESDMSIDYSPELPEFLPDTPDTQSDFKQFCSSLKTMDEAVGQMVQDLEHAGLRDNTLIIYTTDHGVAFPRAKGTLFDAGLETALIMNWPDGINGNRVQNELLCNIDLMPTLLNLAGSDIPKELDGRSFLPLLTEEAVTSRDHFFCELSWHDLYHPMRGIRTQRFKYIRNFEEGPSVYMPFDVYMSSSGQAVKQNYNTSNEAEELYDLKTDPDERNNLTGNNRYQDTLEMLQNTLQQWMKNTNDPLLKGPIPGTTAPEWNNVKE